MMQRSLKILCLAALTAATLPAWSQSCQMRDEIPPLARSSMEAAAQQAFEQAARADVNALRDSAIPSLQASFSGIAAAVNDHKAAFTGARPQLRTSFLLDTGPTPSAEGRFYCGVFGATGLGTGSAEFDIPNLPVGKYAIVIQDFAGSQGPFAFTTIFQDISGWKLAGLYIRPESANGHDGLWYLERAREYKARGQNYNGWFYYVTSWDLLAPVTFMNTRLLSQIIQESSGVQPRDVPVNGSPVNYTSGGKTYKITDISVFPTQTSLDLSLKYSVPSTADFAATQADARALATAYAAQHPELKEAFNNIWAHAVDPAGNDIAGVVTLKPSAKP